jgi:selenide,water dikinase
MINAFKASKLDEEDFEPVLEQMSRLNAEASVLALEHGVRAATDVTGFGLAGHALNVARASKVGLRIRFDDLPVYEEFYDLVERGVSTGCTDANRRNVEAVLEARRGLSEGERELLFDPQTSGGLLLATPADRAEELLDALRVADHRAAEVGEVLEGPVRIQVV